MDEQGVDCVCDAGQWCLRTGVTGAGFVWYTYGVSASGRWDGCQHVGVLEPRCVYVHGTQ